jgi:dihydroorotase
MIGDVLIVDGRIAQIGSNLKSQVRMIEANGKWLFPAFCDPHVHFRTPGQTEKEDLESGCNAALAGGFTSVIQMPNTKPVVDTPALVHELTRDEPLELRVMAAVTKGIMSRDLTDLSSLLKAGAAGFSNDGQPIWTSELMASALEFSKKSGAKIADHAEYKSFHQNGPVRLGPVSKKLNVPGWDPSREWEMVERDIRIAHDTGGYLHICHVSTTRSVEAIRKAKSEGVNVTAEVTPHHLTLTSENVIEFGSNAKMNPPLGDELDRHALVEALSDGTLDCIATDHAPHTVDDKAKGIQDSPFGVTGLETSFPVCYTKLVKPGLITLNRLIDAISISPRRIFGLDRIGLFEGSRADMVLVDVDDNWNIDVRKFMSKGRNCPFDGMKVNGKILWTMYRGKLAYENPESKDGNTNAQ